MSDGLGFAIVVLVLILALLTRSRRMLATAWIHFRDPHPWCVVPGTVRSATVRKTVTWFFLARESIYSADVAYDYAVDGARYVGTGLRPGYFGGSEKGAQRLAALYPPGMGVTVYYDPVDPNVAVLDPRFDRGTLLGGLACLFGVLVLVTMLVALAFVT